MPQRSPLLFSRQSKAARTALLALLLLPCLAGATASAATPADATAPAAAAPATASAALTIPRLFQVPDLSGATLRLPQLSPDGTLVAYLTGAADDKDRLDLWAYDLRAKRHRQLVDARRLRPAAGPLSPEEAARRERQRTSALSGIVEYAFASDSRRLLVPLGGDLYLVDLAAPAGREVRQLTDTPDDETDARFSPQGRYVSFVRSQDLYVIELATGRERAVTRGGGGTVSHGVAEFVAQEEMDRDTGYWWAPDDSHLAWTRVDEAPVAETERFEIGATDIRIVRQRYPFTGAANARVQLFVQPLDAATPPVEVDLGLGDGYLARVQFFPDGRRLAVQRQTRDQRRLELLEFAAATGRGRVLLTETSDDWVPLHDELTFLPARKQFLWASDRSGYRHLYLHAEDGRLVRQLTSGEHMTVGDRGAAAIKAVDERRGLVWFQSAAESPLERHLYRLALDGRTAPVKLTRGAGWHSIRMAKDGSAYLDTFSTTAAPPSVTLHAADGRPLQTLVDNRVVPGHPYHPYAAAHAASEFGTLTAADGQVLHYELLRPKNVPTGTRLPVVVNVYGGPGVQEVTNAWGGTWALFNQYLVSRGYVVFTLDNRGSGQRGRRFEAASFHRLGTVEVDDQVLGVEFLRSLPYVDPQRIGIFGWSYGGYMALMNVLKAPDAFAAAVAGAPVTDWSLYDTHYTERYLGTPAANPAGYAGASVLELAPTLERPLLLVHGMADDNVLFTHSTALMKRLQDAGRPFELMTYPGGKHGLVRHQDQGPHAFATIAAFFDRALAPR